ncbi:MAG: ATP-binding protein [Candidatus Dormibacteria bacterium]
MVFVNRVSELQALQAWWDRPGAGLGLVWGRRRVGKTALLAHFAEGRRTVFHTASGRPVGDELRMLSLAATPALAGGLRDLAARPFTGWDDAFEALGLAAEQEPMLLVLDEFPELVDATPELPGVVRALWDRLRSRTNLKVIFAGSAVRSMEAIQVQRAPLYGRLDLSLLLHPFAPHEAALMLPRLRPADRALVWGLVGGVPLYLEWWDQRRTVADNLRELACTPGGRLLSEGDFLLATEGDLGDLGRRVLFAIAGGRTKHNEIADAIRADPTRALERLVRLRLIERLTPVTEDPRRTRRTLYRIADNFLNFWLGLLDRHRAEIDRGFQGGILATVVQGLDDHLGHPWEEAFRSHLRRLAAAGQFGDDVVAVGPFWNASQDPAEIDAVVLAGRSRSAVLVGEAKWTPRVDGSRLRRELEGRALALPRRAAHCGYAICARDRVTNPADLLRVTATDIFRVPTDP